MVLTRAKSRYMLSGEQVGAWRSSRAVHGLAMQELQGAGLATATAPAASPGRTGVRGAAAIPGRGGRYTSRSSTNHLAHPFPKQEGVTLDCKPSFVASLSQLCFCPQTLSRL